MLARLNACHSTCPALESEGVFVNVDARNFGLLDRRLDWRALGVTLPRRGDLAFRPPRCGLVPDRYRLPLLRPASRAHVALHKFSYHFRLVETVVRRTGDAINMHAKLTGFAVDDEFGVGHGRASVADAELHDACDDIAKLVKELAVPPGSEEATAEYYVRRLARVRPNARTRTTHI